MNWEDLPKRWKDRLRTYLTELGKDLEHLRSGDFPGEGVCLKFEDGSEVGFSYAFTIVDDQLNEIAVFTEHCGYHIFPFLETEIVTNASVERKATLRSELYRDFA